MLSIDLINTFFALWLKPLLILGLILSIVNHAYVFSAAASHCFLVYSLGSTFIGAGLLLLFPGISLSILPHSISHLTNVKIIVDNDFTIGLYVLLAIYILGATWIVFFQIFSYVEIKSLTLRSNAANSATLNVLVAGLRKKLKIKKDIQKLESNILQSPVVWGFFNPTLILPKNYRSWSDSRLERILIHELSHVARNDWMAKMMAKTIAAFFWPVPLVWIVLKKLEWYAELSCDDTVVSIINSRSEYAEDLLSLSKAENTPSCAVSLIKKSTIFLRIQHVLDGRNDRKPLGSMSKIGNALACVAIIFPPSIIYAIPVPPAQAFSRTSIEVHIDNPLRTAQAIQEDSLTSRAILLPKKRAQIMPRRPRFLEEVIITGNKLLLDVGKKIPMDEANLVLASEVLNSNVEFKGFLPHVISAPVYPIKALRRNIEGKVVVEFDVDISGNILNPRILQSQPEKVFDKSALMSLKYSRYMPMVRGGHVLAINNIRETFIFKMSTSTATAKSASVSTKTKLTELDGLVPR